MKKVEIITLYSSDFGALFTGFLHGINVESAHKSK